MSFCGLYINLDRSVDRRLAMERQLQSLSLTSRYRRLRAVDAIDTNPTPTKGLLPGEVACFSSHLQALEQAASSAIPTHILEDDALISSICAEVLADLCKGGVLEDTDILFTETYVPSELGYISSYFQLFRHSLLIDPSTFERKLRHIHLLELRGRASAGLTSYLISATGARKLCDLLDAEVRSGLKTPVDIFVRNKIQDGTLTAKCVFPFLTSITLESGLNTNIPGRPYHSPSVYVSTLLRHSFYVECDWPDLAKEAAKLNPHSDAHRQLLASICDFVVSGGFQQF